MFAGSLENRPAGDPFVFPTVKAKRGHQWNDSTSTFTTSEAYGLYFVGLSVASRSRTQVDFTMVLSGQRYAGITRTSTAHSSSDTIGRDVITPFYAADTVHVSNRYPIYGRAIGFDTSITIFSLTNSMADEVVAFSVAREDTLSGSASPFPFGVSLYNDGFHYDIDSHRFVAPSSGVYYFSFSIGLIARGTANFILYKNDDPVATILYESTTHTGTDTVGRSVMIEMNIDDTVHLVNSGGLTVRSSSLKETSFCGFKYQPKHGNLVGY